jgi:hypothetical protein
MKLFTTLFCKLAIITFLFMGNNGFSQNCPSLNVIGSFFDLSSNSFQNYATTQSNGQCYTLTPPYPAQVCFEYMVPFSDTVRATFHMSACGSLSSIGTGTYNAGCSGTASTNATFTGQSTYDMNCNLIANYIAAGYCGGAVSGDILTVCFDLNTSSGCDPITICPLLFCNTALCSTILPIELLSFESNCIDNATKLKWITLTELNNSHFVVEKSSDGINFEQLTTIAGAGNSSLQIEYSFIDDQTSNELSYYRLKQVDFDSKYSYSSIVVSDCYTNQTNIYNNSTNKTLHIDFQKLNNNSNALIFNGIGQIIHEFQINSLKNIVDMSNYPSGIYHVYILSQNESPISKKIIKL